MIIYEVSLIIEKIIFDDFKKWLNSHVMEMLQFDGFKDAKILSLSEQPEEVDNETLIIQYSIDSSKNLDDYLNQQAKAMRKKAMDLFGNQFIIKRRVLHVDGLYLS